MENHCNPELVVLLKQQAQKITEHVKDTPRVDLIEPVHILESVPPKNVSGH